CTRVRAVTVGVLLRFAVLLRRSHVRAVVRVARLQLEGLRERQAELTVVRRLPERLNQRTAVAPAAGALALAAVLMCPVVVVGVGGFMATALGVAEVLDRE